MNHSPGRENLEAGRTINWHVVSRNNVGSEESSVGFDETAGGEQRQSTNLRDHASAFSVGAYSRDDMLW